MKTMKKIISAILFSVVLFTSCMDDFLDTESPSVQSSENVYTTEAMTESALMGIYSTLPGSFSSTMTIWQGVTDIECMQKFTASGYSASSGNVAPANYYDNANNDRTRWNNLFNTSELATLAVEGIRNSPLLETKPKKMKAYLGEALTLRAMANFELVRLWGDFPFREVSSNSDLSNVYIDKVDKDIILASIVEDLQEAEKYLPWMGNDGYNVERITKGFAKGFLARVALYAGGWSLRDGNKFSSENVEKHPTITEMNGYYIGRIKNWKDYYAIAEQQCAEIIGSSENPHKLDPDFENVWKTVCGLSYNSSNENLFEIGHGVGDTGDVGATTGYSVAAGTKYGGRSLGGNYMTHQAYYFYSFSKEDKRRDVTCVWRSYSADNKEVMSNDIMDVRNGKWRIFWMSNQYLTLFKTAESRIATGINWIMMRYPDVLLMYAEARNELYGADTQNPDAGISARGALERVRERAFGNSSTQIKEYDADFFKAIANERAWEFGGEGIRKQDLVRWGLLSEKIEAMKEGLCLMIDQKQSVTIFDKVYQPSDFSTTVYYKYKDNEFIDESSINYYGDLGYNPGSDYISMDWFPVDYAKKENSSNTKYRDTPLAIITTATGVNANYDYSGLLGKMQYGNEISALLPQYSMGNKVCNYRHYFAIYYEDIYRAKNAFKNSYGF